MSRCSLSSWSRHTRNIFGVGSCGGCIFVSVVGRLGEARVKIGTGICNIYEFLAYKHPHDVDEEACPFLSP